MNEYKFLMYVGKKAEKPDTVARTGIKWIGEGDIKAVPMPQADRLLGHTDVWVEVDEDGNRVTGPLIKKKAAAPAPPDSVGTSSGDTKDENIQKGDTGSADSTPDPDVVAIKMAILTLDRNNPEHFSEQGKPRVAAVRAAAPDIKVDTKLLTEAWKEIEADNA